MPEGVVDQLEAVEIDEDHRQRFAIPARLHDGKFQPVHEQAAVRQSGQNVVAGLKSKAVVSEFLVGDIPGDPIVAMVASQIGQARSGGRALQRSQRQIKVTMAGFRLVELQSQLDRAAFSGAQMPDRRFGSFEILVGDQRGKINAQQIEAIMSQQGLDAVADEAEPAVAIEDEYDIGRVRHQKTMQCLGLLKFQGHAAMCLFQTVAIESRFNPMQQDLGRARFADVVLRTQLQGADRRLDHGIAAENHHRSVASGGAHFLQHREPTFVAEPEVEQRQTDFIAEDERGCVVFVAALQSPVAMRLQQGRQALP